MEAGLKTRVEELSILGGAPAFCEKLHVGRPNIGDRARLLARMNDILDRRWLTNFGPYVQEFQRRIAELAGVKRCVATCNATVALELLVRALGMRGEVIVPSFTFVATAHALQWQEITPVFCDIAPDTCSLNPAEVERLITARTTGIIGVHLWGRPCAIPELEDIASRHGLHLIFDAAHAIGCSAYGKMIGGFGKAEVFSFHATKIINSFEGGAIVTNDEKLADRLELMQNFGFETFDQVSYIGTNGKMSEASAAMGLTSLESLSEFIEVNRRNYHLYQAELNGIPGVRVLPFDERGHANYQYVVLEIDPDGTRLTRDCLQEILWSENVIVRRYFYPGCHRMEPYKTYFPEAGARLPHTERMADRVLCLPTGTAIGEHDVRQIAGIIRLSVSQPTKVKRALQAYNGRIRRGMHAQMKAEQKKRMKMKDEG